MIRSFRHGGLERLFRTGSTRGIGPRWRRRLEVRLDALNVAVAAEDLALPGWRLHRLRGGRRDEWSLRVTGNWRLTFRFENGDVWDVDLVDYH